MSSKKSGHNEGIQATHVKGTVIAVGTGAKAEQHNYAGAAPAQQLEELLAQLKKALADVPAAQQADAEVVTELSEELVAKAQQENPSKKILEIKAENLKKAAEALAEVMPTVAAIATQIIGHILMMAK
jgi:hypothetical protein